MRSFVEEKQAFREIEQLLLRDERFDTVQPKTFVIDNRCWQHFRTYDGVSGVRIEEVSPRTRCATGSVKIRRNGSQIRTFAAGASWSASGRAVWQRGDGRRRLPPGWPPTSRTPIPWPTGSAWRLRQPIFPPKATLNRSKSGSGFALGGCRPVNCRKGHSRPAAGGHGGGAVARRVRS